MALTDYVTLNITQTTVGLTKLGFGTGLFLTYKPTWAERTRTYGSVSDVAVDFPVTTGPENRAAVAYFSQSPAPTQMVFGRGSNKPTKIVQVSAVTPTANLLYTYQLNVKGEGFADTTVSFVSDGTPTDAEYAAGMVAALNAVASKNFTATGATSPISITGNATGAWFSIEVVDPNYQTLTETTADPGVAADLTTIYAENKTWYGLITAWNSSTYGAAAAGWIEANGPHVYIADSNDTRTITTAVGTGDLIDALKTSTYGRSSGFYHPNPAVFAAAAQFGKCLPYTPGSETWALKVLNGIPTFNMTGTHRANITARNGNSYELVAGIGITFNGMTADGKFIDTRRNLDYMQDDMSKRIFAALVAAGKVPMTDPGIATIESQMRGGLKSYADLGMIIESTIVVTVPLATSIATADRTARLLQNCKFSAQLQGAIHKTIITGSITA